MLGLIVSPRDCATIQNVLERLMHATWCSRLVNLNRYEDKINSAHVRLEEMEFHVLYNSIQSIPTQIEVC